MLTGKSPTNPSTAAFFQTELSNAASIPTLTATSSCHETTTTSNAIKNEKCNNDAELSIADWNVNDVVLWAHSIEHFSKTILQCLRHEEIDGRVLLVLCENDIRDLRFRLNYKLSFGDLKKLWLSVRALQERYNTATKACTFAVNNFHCSSNANYTLSCSAFGASAQNIESTPVHRRHHTEAPCCQNAIDNRDAHACGCLLLTSEYIPNVPTGGDSDALTPPMSIDGRAVNIPPEFFKTFISLGYSFLVTWITSFVMVIVHERVPDMKRYPPLPDIFLDNVPHIPWAFHMCEITGTLLFAIWSCVCIFHKYRMVLLRRFFALAGTVFLLRCVTMLITSLSVPGTHLQCDQSDYAVDDADLTLTEALELRISRAYTIWSGLGMSIQGVRTCGDYMFSGHTVALTLLNFFITEYTPRNLYFLHTLTWLLNMFGIFFILAAHEHYSIDVFVAFYITSRLFLYYHTLANNQALMSRDSTRTRIWFPMFSYFESSVDGIIPNEFDTVSSLLDGLIRCLMDIKDSFMLSAQRFAVDPPQFALVTKNLLLLPVSKQHRHVATSTHSAATTTTTTTATTGFQSPISQLSAESLLNADHNAILAATTTTTTANAILNGETNDIEATSTSTSTTTSNVYNGKMKVNIHTSDNNDTTTLQKSPNISKLNLNNNNGKISSNDTTPNNHDELYQLNDAVDAVNVSTAENFVINTNETKKAR